MTVSELTISQQTLRRFILGKQGLFPGRRWQGAAGIAQAMAEGVVIQIDPLCIIARSHDIALHSRVLGYSPELLNQLLYDERAGFDYGCTVMLHPMQTLPYWRVVMARNAARRAYLGEQNQEAMAEVLSALRERGPLANRDFASPPGQKKYWHAAKTTAQALYYLWLSGEVMTHSRRGFERRFDLAERIVPPQFHYTATVDEAEDYFARRCLQELGMASLRAWRGWFMGMIERKAAMEEAVERMRALLASGAVAQVKLTGDDKDPLRYLLASDLPLLEELHAGRIPAAWQPIETSTSAEARFLAPLDIVSVRGRALPLFNFDYVWEVYKPAEQRRWGYYVLPILVGARLIGRIEPVLDRPNRRMIIRKLWLEEDTPFDEGLETAINAGLKRFASFTGIEEEQVIWEPAALAVKTIAPIISM
jgi:uncharacterized protein YcaQ